MAKRIIVTKIVQTTTWSWWQSRSNKVCVVTWRRRSSRSAPPIYPLPSANTAPDIVEKLGGERPTDLVHEDFGVIWHVSGPEKTTTRAHLSL